MFDLLLKLFLVRNYFTNSSGSMYFVLKVIGVVYFSMFGGPPAFVFFLVLA